MAWTRGASFKDWLMPSASLFFHSRGRELLLEFTKGMQLLDYVTIRKRKMLFKVSSQKLSRTYPTCQIQSDDAG